MKSFAVLAALILFATILVLWPKERRFRSGLATGEQRELARQAVDLAKKVDWNEIRDQAVMDLQTYIRFATDNPPGDTGAAARWLAGRLQAEGIAAAIEETAPGRFNVIGRLPGTTRKPAILLIHHLDVVPVDAAEWTHDPFAGELVDGEVWGRGAVDDKGPGVMGLAGLIALRRADVQLERDVIFIAVADEEVGGELGMKALVDRHPEWQDAAIALIADGAFGITVEGLNVLPIATAEKSSVAVKIAYEGQGGHASVPIANQPMRELAAAMERLASAKQKTNLGPESLEFFGRLGAHMGGVKGWLLQRLSHAPVQWVVLPALRKTPLLAAMVQPTASWTGLSSGVKYNIIPGRAEALLDVRILPGMTPNETLAWITKTLDLPGAEVAEVYEFKTPSRTPFATPWFALAEAVSTQLRPGAVVAPVLSPGATDGRHTRPAGIPTYVVVPAFLENELLQTAHSKNERMPVAVLEEGARGFFAYLAAMGRNP